VRHAHLWDHASHISLQDRDGAFAAIGARPGVWASRGATLSANYTFGSSITFIDRRRSPCSGRTTGRGGLTCLLTGHDLRHQSGQACRPTDSLRGHPTGSRRARFSLQHTASETAVRHAPRYIGAAGFIGSHLGKQLRGACICRCVEQGVRVEKILHRDRVGLATSPRRSR
jgi:hypothetical protein